MDTLDWIIFLWVPLALIIVFSIIGIIWASKEIEIDIGALHPTLPNRRCEHCGEEIDEPKDFIPPVPISPLC